MGWPYRAACTGKPSNAGLAVEASKHWSACWHGCMRSALLHPRPHRNQILASGSLSASARRPGLAAVHAQGRGSRSRGAQRRGAGAQGPLQLPRLLPAGLQVPGGPGALPQRGWGPCALGLVQVGPLSISLPFWSLEPPSWLQLRGTWWTCCLKSSLVVFTYLPIRGPQLQCAALPLAHDRSGCRQDGASRLWGPCRAAQRGCSDACGSIWTQGAGGLALQGGLGEAA